MRNYLDQHPIRGAAEESTAASTPTPSIFLGDRWEQLDLDRTPVPFAPAIAAEVLSFSKHILDVNQKVPDYLAAGSQLLWLLDQENGELHVRTKRAFGCWMQAMSSIRPSCLASP